MLYKNLPRNVGLKRLTLHKSATGPNVNYILLVECSHFLDNINQVVKIILKMSINSPSYRQPTCCQCYEPGYAVIPESSASLSPSDPQHLGAGVPAPRPNRAPTPRAP